MAGLAGIARPGMQEQVHLMLEKIKHRGQARSEISVLPSITLGFVWDQTGDHSLAQLAEENLILKRDPLGIVPIYYGWNNEGDLYFASEVKALLRVIYYLESFDAWLVRSSLLNFLVGRNAADFVPAVFSGEGGDELFAGYEYLKTLDASLLADELIDITSRLHNTALQRVDRCSTAHGLVAYVPFLDQSVVSYALRIPVRYKLFGSTEKWILRQAMIGSLPDVVLNRPKAKFWQGAGVGELLALYAEERISDADFAQERCLTNGWLLNSKEELLYYRIFKEHFGNLSDLEWMGRTKGTPVA
jgi:asparagine synthase (glutamine-hydrolysing)